MGFIWADGNLSKEEDKISIRTSDYDLALKIFDVVSDKEKRKIYKQTYEKEAHNDSYMIINTNKEVINSLKEFGITSRKSLTISFPKNIPSEYLGSFIRGYFDGDGCIYISNTFKDKKYFAISFSSGSELFINELKSVLFQYFEIESTINKDKRVYGGYVLKIYKQENIKKIKNIFYENASIFLERKYNIFCE